VEDCCPHREAINVRLNHLEESDRKMWSKIDRISTAAWTATGAVILQLLIMLGQVFGK